MKRYFKLVLLLGISLIFLTGCIVDLVIPENDSSSPIQEDGVISEKGTLKIYLTDAPGDYSEVDIIISRIEGHIAGDGEGGEDKGSWEVLKDWPDGLAVNLIELKNVSILLGSEELATNKYTQLRIFLKEEATLVLEGEEGEDGPTVPLEIPSSANTGIKLNRPFEIVAGSITKLTIDFDAEKSVIKTGNGKYKMKPVIHVTSEIYSEEEVSTSSVFGTVSYDGGDLGLIGIVEASVSLSGGEYIFLYNTSTEEGGTFIFDNVPVGNCVLNVYADGFDDYFESIEVIGGSDTEVNVVFLLETPGGISGSVVDSVDKSAIGGATVTVTLSGGSTYIFESTTETDTGGNFSIEQLPVGIYDLSVSAEGYDESTLGGIAVTEGAINNIEDEIKLTLSTPSP